MHTLTETVKKMLNALAFADAGEYLTPLQKAHLLSPSTSNAAVTPAASEHLAAPAHRHQRVALYMGSELPPEMMDYVLQTCTRLKHALTVLSFQTENAARAQLKPYSDTLLAAGIDMQLVTLTGDPVTGLARYLRRHPEVAFLACNETGYLGRCFLNGSQRQNALPVPVVLIESQSSNDLGISQAATTTRDEHVA